MKRLSIIAAMIAAVILQSTICSFVCWKGLKPDLVTVIVILTGLIHGLVPGCAAGFIGGFILDYFTGRLLGAGALSKMAIGGLSGWISPKIFGDHLLVPPTSVLVGTWLEQTIYLLLVNAFGRGLPVIRSLWTIVLPVGLINVVFAFPVYYALLALERIPSQGGTGEDG
ncbi:MAG: rod shape-determining protein MreD [Firmicutes bacterium]|nr:rod shape-determining protein MreD [Bacillota bacterium]